MSAWLAYICALQGHVGNGTGVGTNSVVWSTYCVRCGAKVRAS